MIAAMSTVAAVTAKTATTTIPIVFVAAEDPVRVGLVASLARPGGNATGVNFFVGELTAKRLELLRELVPAIARVAVLVDPNNVAGTESTLRDAEPAAHAMGLQIQVVRAGTSGDIDAAFESLVRNRVDALIVGSSSFFASRRIHIANRAMRHGIPTIYNQREFPEIGGLISYGTNLTDAWRQAGSYAGRISRVPNPPTCRSCSQPSSSWSSTPLESSNARARSAALAARPRRRGDRMNNPPRVHWSAP